jgi:L-ascorbate metabolism protein UlaG (beta-lactamase superfamily)
MQIIWHGQSCFEIITTPAKNGQVKIVVDPFSEEIGLRLPKLEADIVLVTYSHSDHNNVKAISGTPFLVEGPGEYEIKNVFIQGIASFHDSSQGKERGERTIYTIEAEEMRLCHLGDLGQNELTEEQLEKIGECDILMIPIGGTFTISAKEAVKIMSQIEPKITIPMHYQIPYSGRRPDGSYRPKLKLKLDGLDKFLKPLGIKSIVPVNKLSLKKKDIPTEEAKIIVLNP